MFGILVGVQQLSRSSFGFMLTFVKCRQIRHMLHTCMSGVPLMETSVKHRDNALVQVMGKTAECCIMLPLCQAPEQETGTAQWTGVLPSLRGSGGTCSCLCAVNLSSAGSHQHSRDGTWGQLEIHPGLPHPFLAPSRADFNIKPNTDSFSVFSPNYCCMTENKGRSLPN